MKLPGLFRLPTYKRFEYNPRTYDARKEAIKQRQIVRREEFKRMNKESVEKMENLELQERNTYLKERFSEYKRDSSKKNNTFMNIVFTMLILSVLLTAFVGIGQFYLDMKNKKIVWNDFLSYSLMLICITYFLIRYNKRQ